MFKQCSLTLVVIMLWLAPVAKAQDGKPTVAVLRLGPSLSDTSLETAVMDTLHVYGWIDAEELALVSERQDLAGEKINIIWGDANYDLPTVSVMVDNALDRGADIPAHPVHAGHADCSEHHTGSRRAHPCSILLRLQSLSRRSG